MRAFTTKLLILLFITHSLLAQTFEVEPRSGGVIAIGDIHADAEAFVDALVGNGILDEAGNFIAQDKNIVLLGDLTDKGPNTLAVWDIVNMIKRESAKNGSDVHVLFGNHDSVVLMGELKRMYPEDLERFSSFDPDPATGVKRALVSEPYKSMMRQWKTMIKIDDTLFVHGGVDNWMLDLEPEKVNETVMNYVLDQQQFIEDELAGKNPKPVEVPDVLEPWIFDSEDPFPDNPLWSRELSHGKIEPEDLKKIMDDLGVKKIVVGHTPTKSRAIELMYDGALIRADTNISRGFKGGQISGVHIDANGKIELINDLPRGATLDTFNALSLPSMTSCLIKGLAN